MVIKSEAIKVTEKSVPVVSAWPFMSPAPLNWAISTVPPMVIPRQKELIIKQSMEALLTAASPAFPTVLPTTSISAML